MDQNLMAEGAMSGVWIVEYTSTRTGKFRKISKQNSEQPISKISFLSTSSNSAWALQVITTIFWKRIMLFPLPSTGCFQKKMHPQIKSSNFNRVFRFSIIKPSILIGCSMIFSIYHPFWGTQRTPMFWVQHPTPLLNIQEAG